MKVGLTRIVRFDIFCPNCKYYTAPEEERPCYECLSTPAVEHSKVPIHYVGKPHSKTIIELLEEANNTKMDEQWKHYIEQLIETKVDKVEGKGLSTNDLTDKIMDQITKEIPDNILQLSLAIANKVVKEEGKGLSSNDFTDDLKDKLENGIPEDISDLTDIEEMIPKELNDLIDVELENLEEGHIMAYNEETKCFNNMELPDSGGSLVDDLDVAVDVGGIHAGTTYEAGTNIEDVLSDMLEPTLYPSFVDPTANISANPGNTLYETGSSQNVKFTITFNRGVIIPSYGTNGKRAGEAINYEMNTSETPQSSNVFSETITESGNYNGKVNYEAGEQPKDSKGNDYKSPLPAGHVFSNTIHFEFVDAIWANTGSIANVTKQTLVSKSAKVKEFNFPAQTVAFPEVFDVPASWTVTAVEVLNTLSNQWEDCKSEFTVSDVVHPNAGGTIVNYKRYTDNRGYAAAGRKVRVKWSN
jgi:hypothetical protein